MSAASPGRARRNNRLHTAATWIGNGALAAGVFLLWSVLAERASEDGLRHAGADGCTTFVYRNPLTGREEAPRGRTGCPGR